MDTLWHDVRSGARQLLKHPGFACVAVLTLGLGIGANTAIFSIAYHVLLRPLPYPEPERIAGVAQVSQGHADELNVTYGEFQFLGERATMFESLAATTELGFNLFANDQAEHIDGLLVSQNYFQTLGVSPRLGRAFTAEEDTPGGASVAVLGHALWVRRFGADPQVIGRNILLNGHPYTVVGVMPAGFQSLQPGGLQSHPPELWTTLAQVGRTVGSGENLHLVGRLRRGVSLSQAQARMSGISAAFHQVYEPQQMIAKDVSLSLLPYNALVVSSAGPAIRILFGAIGFVLLIACANVAALLLGRTLARERELAMRAALGASRWRITRQLLTESLLLAAVSGVVGMMLGAWGLQLLIGIIPDDLPRAAEIHLDASALMFTMVLALGTGVVFGVVPAWLMAVRGDKPVAKDSGARTIGSARGTRLRDALVIGEIALSLILLAGAGLMIRTVGNLLHINPGFDAAHSASAEIWLDGTQYNTTAAVSAYYDQLTGRLATVPGVTAAAVVEAGAPLERGGNMSAALDGTRVSGVVWYRTVTRDYFTTLGIPVRGGRIFDRTETGSSDQVAVVNAAFVARYIPSGDPLTHTVQVGNSDVGPRRIVGVVGDVRSFIGAPAEPAVYLPSPQTPIVFTRMFGGWFPIHVLVRTTGDPATVLNAIRRTIRAVDPSVPVGRVRAMGGVLSSTLAVQRFLMLLLAIFAGLGITLAVVGSYGLISFVVAQRTRDIGVRIALGANPARVLRMVLGRGAALALTGSVLGLVGALALTRLLQNQLFGIQATDPAIFGSVTALLMGTVFIAAYIPARRAARLDPVIALRSD